MYDIAVIGGGIVGVATAYKLSLRYPHLSLLIIEKEKELAYHQTGRNSGVIHSGLYYPPGSLKAKNCVKGRRELVAFARKYKIKHEVCGKIVVAVEEREIPFMNKIFENGIANEVEGIEKISAAQIREIEPYARGIAGIWVPCTGIIDYKGATIKMGELMLAQNPHNKIILGEYVKGFEHRSSTEIEIITHKNTYFTRNMIVCGGLFADRLAKLDKIPLKEKVVGFRGDYYELTEQARHKVRNLIYPVPDPKFPFLGVHFTRMYNGDIECGPNAVFTFKREGYRKTDFSLKDTLDALSYRGTWNLFIKNMRYGINEYKRAFSKKLFLKTLQRIIPSLTMEDIKPGRSGVRALLLREDGDTKDDFRIIHQANRIHVLNAPSPAATACLAIGEHIANMAGQQFHL